MDGAGLISAAMGIVCALAVLVVEREWVATPRGENFDEFAHSSCEMLKRAMRKVLVLHDSRPI